VTQDQARFGLDLVRLLSEAKTALKRLEAHAKAVHAAGGDFEDGNFAVKVLETEQRRPSWKGEAMDLAEALATLRGEVFDAEVFAANVKASTKPTKSVRVKFEAKE
jgi:hypothetical protein